MRSLLHTTSTLPSGAVVHTWSPPISLLVRATVILQHGYGEYAERYVSYHNELIPKLTDRGFEVKAIDLIGHGCSHGDVRGVCDIREAVQDHLQLRNDILQKNQGTPVFLIGNSLGGVVTAGSVAADGNNILGVILLAPAFPPVIPSIAKSALGIPAYFVPSWSILSKRSAPSELSRIPEIGQAIAGDPMMVKQSISFLLAVTVLDTMDDVRKSYSTWNVPTLVIRGTADNATDEKWCTEFVEKIASSDRKMSFYEGGKHELLNDLVRDDVLNEIFYFLDTHLE